MNAPSSPPAPKDRPVSLLLCALGGEGGGVLTDWLVDTARQAGYAAQATSVPGVAQRTGATTYYVEVYPVPLADCGGRRPVFGLNPLPGRLDALVSSELLETGRQIANGMVSRDHTLLISSSARTYTTAEKMVMGDGRAADDDLLALVRQHSRAHHVVDMARMTRQAGTVVSAVMLGCIAASGLLPMSRRDYESVIGASGSSAQASLRGFAMAYETIERQRQQAQYVETVWRPPAQDSPQPDRLGTLPAQAQGLPAAAMDMVRLGHERLVEYQDATYAAQYLQRLQRLHAAERQADPSGEHQGAIVKEMARWLALWMAFDDVVRVADLKSRRSRMARVQQEVKADAADVLKVYDHFKPGIPELAGLLPQGLAARLIAWDQRRVQRDLKPWAMPLKIATHSVSGFLALRFMASLKRLRRRGSRFALEQSLIERWLARVEACTREHWALGYEVALCGQLIKGYGSTNERGKDNLLHIIDHLASPSETPAPSATERAKAVRAARLAALTDEAGKALDQVLVGHGAPARPLKAQPIHWVKRPQRTTHQPG